MSARKGDYRRRDDDREPVLARAPLPPRPVMDYEDTARRSSYARGDGRGRDEGNSSSRYGSGRMGRRSPSPAGRSNDKFADRRSRDLDSDRSYAYSDNRDRRPDRRASPPSSSAKGSYAGSRYSGDDRRRDDTYDRRSTQTKSSYNDSQYRDTGRKGAARNDREDKFSKQRAPPPARPTDINSESNTVSSEAPTSLRRERDREEEGEEDGEAEEGEDRPTLRDTGKEPQSKRPRLDLEDSSVETSLAESSSKSRPLSTASASGVTVPAQAGKTKGKYERPPDRDSTREDSYATTDRSTRVPPPSRDTRDADVNGYRDDRQGRPRSQKEIYEKIQLRRSLSPTAPPATFRTTYRKPPPARSRSPSPRRSLSPSSSVRSRRARRPPSPGSPVVARKVWVPGPGGGRIEPAGERGRSRSRSFSRSPPPAARHRRAPSLTSSATYSRRTSLSPEPGFRGRDSRNDYKARPISPDVQKPPRVWQQRDRRPSPSYDLNVAPEPAPIPVQADQPQASTNNWPARGHVSSSNHSGFNGDVNLRDQGYEPRGQSMFRQGSNGVDPPPHHHQHDAAVPPYRPPFHMHDQPQPAPHIFPGAEGHYSATSQPEQQHQQQYQYPPQSSHPGYIASVQPDHSQQQPHQYQQPPSHAPAQSSYYPPPFQPNQQLPPQHASQYPDPSQLIQPQPSPQFRQSPVQDMSTPHHLPNQYQQPSIPHGFPLPPSIPLPPGMAQSPTVPQGSPEVRQLAMGIRAPLPGPNTPAVKGFRPIAGFVPLPPSLQQHQAQNPGYTPINGESDFAAPPPRLPFEQAESGQHTPISRFPASAGLPAPPHLAWQQQQQHVQQSPQSTAPYGNALESPRQPLPPQNMHGPQDSGHVYAASSYQYRPESRQEQRPAELPSSHAPPFPGLASPETTTSIHPGLPALPPNISQSQPAQRQTPSTQANAAPPPSPAASSTSGLRLPPKPSFTASTVLPSFLPAKPTFAALSPVTPSQTLQSLQNSLPPVPTITPLPSSLPTPPAKISLQLLQRDQPGAAAKNKVQAKEPPWGSESGLPPNPFKRAAMMQDKEQRSPSPSAAEPVEQKKPALAPALPLSGLQALPRRPVTDWDTQPAPVMQESVPASPTSPETLPASPGPEQQADKPLDTSPKHIEQEMTTETPLSMTPSANAPSTEQQVAAPAKNGKDTSTRTSSKPRELYERLTQVGEGTYGKVYKARNTGTGTLVAMKRIRMEAEKDGFPVTSVREIKLLQSLTHDNVVRLQEMMVSRGHVYMVFEYLDHDLTGILHHPNVSFSPANLKSLMQQLLLGLDYIHWRGVLHRDLKGSNILLSKHGELKIADFGLAKFYAKGKKNDYTNRVITQWYKPPELLFGATVYGPEVDVWSAGCIFLELFTKRPVFQGQDEIHQLDVIFKLMGTPREETWPGLSELPWYELVKPKKELPAIFRTAFSPDYISSPAALDLAEALLAFDPAARPSAADALKMPYFTTEEPQAAQATWLAEIKGDWHEMESKEASRRKRGEGRRQQQAQEQAMKQKQQA